MNLLEGSIAFALAMAGLATLCTVLIEILHRAVGLRSDGLKKMLDAYFDDVIRPKLSGKAEDLREDLMDKLSNSNLLAKIHPEPLGGHGLLGRALGLYRTRLLLTRSLTPEEFLQRLPDTELFKQLKADTAEKTQAQLEHLADKYDQYSAAASDYFKRRAQLLSLLMGIALALFGNIHALRIFDTFVKNPEVAQAMQAQAGAIKAGIDRLPQAAADVSADAKAQLDQAKTDIADVTASLTKYQAMGLPIGWNYYPNCLGAGKTDPRCQALNIKPKADEKPGTFCSVTGTLWHDLGAAFMWLFTIVFTGLLIGLGGPFWYDLAMNLSRAKQAVGGNTPAQEAAPPQVSARDKAIANAVGQLIPDAAAAPATQGKQPWDDKPW